MKRVAIIVYGCLALFILCAFPDKAQTPATGDDLAIALQNHGMDATTAAAGAVGIEVAIANNLDVLKRIKALEQAQATAVSPWVGVDQVKNFIHSDTVDPTFDVGLPGISDKTFIYIRAGDSLDFPLNVPAGTNALAVAVSTGGALGTFHFEFPAGTKIGATVTVPNTRNWSSYATEIVPVGSLPVGNVTVRWVCETAGMNVAGVKPAKQ